MVLVPQQVTSCFNDDLFNKNKILQSLMTQFQKAAN